MSGAIDRVRAIAVDWHRCAHADGAEVRVFVGDVDAVLSALDEWRFEREAMRSDDRALRVELTRTRDQVDAMIADRDAHRTRADAAEADALRAQVDSDAALISALADAGGALAEALDATGAR